MINIIEGFLLGKLMRIFEFFGENPEKKEVDFDLHDDLAFFMQNDPEFYRKDYFPFLDKFHSSCKKGNELSPAIFKNVVLRGYNDYKKKFPVEGLENSLSMEDLKEVCTKMYKEELDNFKNEQTPKGK